MSNTQITNQEVTWRTLGLPTYGTITAPTDKPIHGAVILVAGSGPTDRNWCSPLLPGTNGSGQLLAETLAKQGYVTLRYDKLASGPHVQETIPKIIGKISMQSHLEELQGAVETLLALTKVDPTELFVLANSEGCIHAVNYQQQAKTNRFKGLVLTGAPGKAVGELARGQIFEQVKQLPNAEELMKRYDDAIAQFAEGKPMTIDESLPKLMQLVLQSLATPFNLPFSKELWLYSLPEHISQVAEPLLVVIGKKDIQVDWQTDGQLIEKANAQKTNVTFVYPEDANHVLKHEDKPREALDAQTVTLHYNDANTTLDRETVDAIVDWLKKQAQNSPI
jgi:alpha-beta hydrolase superfamily lysophospholipase